MRLLLGPPGAGTSMLARRLATLLPAMTLAEARETIRIPRGADLTGGRRAFVTTRPCRAPHHTISEGGLIGGGPRPLPGRCPWRPMASGLWMRCPRANAMSSKSCANRSRRVSSHNHCAHISDFRALAALVEHVKAATP